MKYETKQKLIDGAGLAAKVVGGAALFGIGLSPLIVGAYEGFTGDQTPRTHVGDYKLALTSISASMGVGLIGANTPEMNDLYTGKEAGLPSLMAILSAPAWYGIGYGLGKYWKGAM